MKECSGIIDKAGNKDKLDYEKKKHCKRGNQPIS